MPPRKELVRAIFTSDEFFSDRARFGLVVNALAEQVERHHHALCVPPRTAVAPQRFPRRLVVERRLPQHEVEWVALVRIVGPATAFGAMQRLFAGPTQAELARGLKFVSSGAAGFKILSIRHGVARVQLYGKISSGGSTFTIANEIMPTLKQFRSVHWVKIYDRSGHTERPFGPSDSIPFSLEP